RSRLRRLEKLRPAKIQEHSFFFAADDAITPAMRRCFPDHRAPENGEGVPLFPIRRLDFSSCVTAHEHRGENHRRGTTSVDEGSLFLRHAMTANAISNKLQGAKRWSRCGR